MCECMGLGGWRLLPFSFINTRNNKIIICVFVSEFINVVSRRKTRAREGDRYTLQL